MIEEDLIHVWTWKAKGGERGLERGDETLLARTRRMEYGKKRGYVVWGGGGGM